MQDAGTSGPARRAGVLSDARDATSLRAHAAAGGTGSPRAEPASHHITTLVLPALFARFPWSSRRRAIFSRTWATPEPTASEGAQSRRH